MQKKRKFSGFRMPKAGEKSAAILALLLLFILALSSIASASTFTFSPDPIGTVFNISQGQLFHYDFNVSSQQNKVNFTLSQTSYSNISIGKSTGLLSILPSNGDVGYDSGGVVIIATNITNGNDYATTKIYFNISNVNDPPYFNSHSPSNISQNTSENKSILFSVNATDPDFAYTDTNNASWYVNGNLINSTNYTYSSAKSYSSSLNYTFSYCSAGINNISIILNDTAGAEAMLNWTVNVSNVNRPIIFNGSIANYSWNESTNITNAFNIYNRFIDYDRLQCAGANKDNLTFNVTGNSNITVDINTTTGNVSFYSPKYWQGIENITINASDGYSSTLSNTFELIVNGTPNPPVMENVSNQSATVNVPFILYVKVTDPDLPYGDNITYSDNSSLFNFTWYNMSGNESYGIINFTPTSGDTGVYDINISANDTTNRSDSKVFTLSIQPNNPPILNPVANLNATQGISKQFNFSGYDPDPGDNLTFYTNSSLFGLPYNNTVGAYQMSIYNATQGSFTFTPNATQVGNFSVRFFARDPKGATNSTTVNFEVINVNDAPVITQPQTGTIEYAEVNKTFNLQINATDWDLPYGDSLNFTDNTTLFNISAATVNSYNASATISFNATDVQAGNYTVNISATDKAGTQSTIILTFYVRPPTAPVLDNITNLTAYESEPYINIISATDANNQFLNFTFNDTIWSNHSTRYNATAYIINTTYTNITLPLNYSINITVTDPDNLSDSKIVNFIIMPTDHAPNITGNRTLQFFDRQNISNTFSIANFSVIDPEGDAWNVTSNNSLFNITKYNSTLAIINQTFNDSMVGFYMVNFTATEIANATLHTSIIVNITINNSFVAPRVLNYTPQNFTISTAENDTLNFSANITDDDFKFNDSVTARWIFAGSIVKTQTNITNTTQINLTQFIGFCDSGNKTIKLNLTDSHNKSSVLQWNLIINNTNRPPVFGEFMYNATDLNSSSKVNSSNTGYNSSYVYQSNTSAEGNITSGVIDFVGSGVTVPDVTFGQFEILGSFNANSSVYYQVRGGDNLNSLSNWSAPKSPGSSIVFPSGSGKGRFLQFRLVFNNTNNASANVTGIIVHFTLNGFEMYKDQSKDLVYNLAKDFSDPDSACAGSAAGTITNAGDSRFNLDINPTTLVLSKVSDTGSTTGQATLKLNYSDGYSSVLSNPIIVNISEAKATSNTRTVYRTVSGGTTVITQRVQVPKNKYVPVNIIVPGIVSMYENDTLTVPITIQNTANETLSGISLSAESKNENVSFRWQNDTIPKLDKNENMTTNLTIVSYQTYGNYEVSIHANITSPKLNATNNFYVNSIALGQAGKNVYNTKLAFTKDLLSSNPECLELNEQLQKAVGYANNNSFENATALLNDITDNCKYLMSLGANQTASGNNKNIWDRLTSGITTQAMIYGIIMFLVIVLMGIMFGFFYFRQPFSAEKKKQEEEARAQAEEEEAEEEE